MQLVYKGLQIGGRAALGVYIIRTGRYSRLNMRVSQCLDSNMAALGEVIFGAALLLFCFYVILRVRLAI